MKVVSRPIDAIVVFKSREHPLPYKFRFTDSGTGEQKIIYIDKILFVDERVLAGVNMIVYECQSKLDDTDIRYQLKYFVQSCSWELYKI